MAKVLISFLGTGRLKDKNDPKREYEPTKYRIDGQEYEYSFVSVALKKSLSIDKMILLGTPHSMWEEVYNIYSHSKGEFDFSIWTKIGDECAKKDHKSPLEIPHQKNIEQAMGDGSKVVLVHYGLTPEEIRQNSEIILGLDDQFDEGDEIFVDITHSFRSLPLYIMNLLIYLRDVSTKKVSIKGIYYGMLEANSELGYTPIVNMSEVMSVNSWISGAYSFMEFGNAYKISSLIESDSRIAEPKRFCKPLQGFTNAKNLNHLAELENQVQKLQILRNTSGLPTIAKMIVEPVIGNFLSTVRVGNGKFQHSDFQYQLAIWQKRNFNYAAAYISLNEAILTRACELFRFDSNDYVQREYMKDIFRWARGNANAEAKLRELALLELVKDSREQLKEYSILYNKVARNRNAIAHSLTDDSGRVTNTVHNMIRDLNTFIKQYKDNL